jgi:hypothetical protein
MTGTELNPKRRLVLGGTVQVATAHTTRFQRRESSELDCEAVFGAGGGSAQKLN